jgi:hypothetical protein
MQVNYRKRIKESMVKYIFSVLVISISILLFSCKENKYTNSDSTLVAFKPHNKSMNSGKDCGLPDSMVMECAVLDVAWLEPLSSNNNLNSAISDTLDYFIKGMIGECIFPEENHFRYGSLSLDSLAKIYFNQHQEFINEFPEAVSKVWSIDINVDSIYQNTKTISLAVNGYTYLGGAHPNSFTSYHSFEKSTGRIISLADIIIKYKEFLKIAEKEFRKNQEITEEQDLEEAGYFFDEGKYALPSQFCITGDGLHLFYNNYEAAAYAVGQISYTIPYEMLQDIIDLSKIR